MKFEIQPILNGYIAIKQNEPQVGEIVLHVAEAEYFATEIRKAAFKHRINQEAPPPSRKKNG